METIFKFIYEFQIENLYVLLNSQFSSSIFGALAGAFAGAYAAHKIASNAKKREEIEMQLRAINVAISSAFLICNETLSLKRQHIETLYKSYMANRTEYENALLSPPAEGQIHFSPDLKTLHMPHMPLKVLEKNVYEKITIKGRPLALISTISNSIELLRSDLDHRNKLIEDFKVLFPNIPNKDRLDYYFGFPLLDRSVHQEYLDVMKGLYQYTDDVIFFSSLLCEDLNKHGNKLRDIYKKQYSKKIDEITDFEFNTPKAVTIWPNEDNYKDWLKMFAEHNEDLSWYKRIFTSNKNNKTDNV